MLRSIGLPCYGLSDLGGLFARFCGVSILKLALISRKRLVLCWRKLVGAAMPKLDGKLEKLGVSKALVGVIDVPKGYTFNPTAQAVT